ncbi:MAG: hypothetical protein AB8F65_15010 [Woeseiaceae bacterium]
MSTMKTVLQRLARYYKAIACSLTLGVMLSSNAPAQTSGDLDAICVLNTCLVFIYLYNPATGNVEWQFMTSVTRPVWEYYLLHNVPQ